MTFDPEILPSRIQTRLIQLNISASEATRRSGLAKDFIYDIINKKKTSPRAKNLELLAKALECDVEYLIGKSQSPQSDNPWNYASLSGKDFIQNKGFVGAGMWLEAEEGDTFSIRNYKRAYFPSDPRYSNAFQFDLEIRGTSANKIAVPGQYVRAVDKFAWQWPLKGGDIVVVSRTENDLRELTLRRLKPWKGEDDREKGYRLEFETTDPRWLGQSVPIVDLYGDSPDGSDVTVSVEAVALYVYGLASIGEDGTE